MNITNFKWSLGKCIHCGKCLKVCPGDLFIFDDKNELKIKEIDCLVGMDVGSVIIVWLYVQLGQFLFLIKILKIV